MYTCSVTQDVWRHLKTIVYAIPVNDVQTLQERVINACRNIKQQPGVFHYVEGQRNALPWADVTLIIYYEWTQLEQVYKCT
ncbi:hypothetical protein C0J52_04259 [Blattella germanica]|nr:hypothetical protein C0J52_04259 [Blattella germanica]